MFVDIYFIMASSDVLYMLGYNYNFPFLFKSEVGHKTCQQSKSCFSKAAAKFR